MERTKSSRFLNIKFSILIFHHSLESSSVGVRKTSRKDKSSDVRLDNSTGNNSSVIETRRRRTGWELASTSKPPVGYYDDVY